MPAPRLRRAPSNHENNAFPSPLTGEGAGEGGISWVPPHLNPLPRGGRGGVWLFSEGREPPFFGRTRTGVVSQDEESFSPPTRRDSGTIDP